MSVEFSIKVSLPVFKQLTARLEEGQCHDDVIRDLLGIDSILELENPDTSATALTHQISDILQSGSTGFVSRGLWLPNGTKLRARYKQREYRATVDHGVWIDEQGEKRTSPSAAAFAVTGNTVNGLRFWEAMRPADTGWRRLDTLVPQ
jgi:hypothetical protein